jgi:hypothetical protein
MLFQLLRKNNSTWPSWGSLRCLPRLTARGFLAILRELSCPWPIASIVDANGEVARDVTLQLPGSHD